MNKSKTNQNQSQKINWKKISAEEVTVQDLTDFAEAIGMKLQIRFR